MRLPNGCKKWVKDSFTLEQADLKIKQQEEEIKKLKKQNALLRFDLLPKDESYWAMMAFDVLGWKMFSNEVFDFKEAYMSHRDEITSDELPF